MERCSTLPLSQAEQQHQPQGDDHVQAVSVLQNEQKDDEGQQDIAQIQIVQMEALSRSETV